MPARHLLCGDPADLGRTFLGLWRAWRRTPEGTEAIATGPVHVVVPGPAQGHAWKRLLVENGEPVFNAAFVTPGQLRTLLSERLLDDRTPLWGREELDFILRQTAEGAGESPLCRSLARDASPLRRALDEIASAGHSFRALLADEGLGEFREAWERIEARLSPALRAGRDRRLLAAAQKKPRSMPGTLIVAGCGIRQAADFALLETALTAWEQSAVLTLLAAAGQETIEGPWLDLVARALPGASTSFPGTEPEPEAPAASEEQKPLFRFYLAPDRNAEAALIVRQVRAWLGQAEPGGPAPRIGLVFPEEGPLVSRVAQLLRDGGIPFDSTFQTPLPPRLEQAILSDWLDLQRDGLWAEPFLLFWRKAVGVPAFAEAFGDPPLWGGSLEDRFADAYGRILSDRVTVLASLLRSQGRELPALEKFLSWWKRSGQWPAEAPLGAYAERLGAQLDLLVGPDYGKPIRGFLARELARLAAFRKEPVSRAAACDLLGGFVSRPETARDFSSWAPVHLLAPEDARTSEWDHLFLSGLETGRWPGTDQPVTLLDDGLRERLNAQARRPSPDGGEETGYIPGFAPLLTAATRYRLARETFATLLESARGEAALGAGTRDELEGDRRLYPSELFRETWERERGIPWDDATAPAATSPEPPAGEAEETARAVHARRNAQTAFDEFSFMLRSRPAPRPLSAKAAEQTLQDPATAWFRHFLKMEVERPTWLDGEAWPLFQGLLLHRLFERSLSRFRIEEGPWVPRPAPAVWRDALDDEWRRTGESLLRVFAEAEEPPPGWWRSEWPRIGEAARRLLGKCAEQIPEGYSHLAPEFELALPVGGPGPLPLAWRSRADLIGIDGPVLSAATKALIVDFKTGRKADDFDPGTTAENASYFQLVVYAALLRAENPHLAETSVLILHRGFDAPATPVPVDPSEARYGPLWAVLREAWIEGRFGQFLAVRDRFKKTSTLPLATLEIPDHILSEKWALTPGLDTWERKRD